MILTLPYPISTNRLHKPNGRGGMMTTDEVKDYKKVVWVLAYMQHAEVLTGDLLMRMDIYRPQNAGDADNRIKLVQDSLNGIAYKDDKQISSLQINRFTRPSNPCVVVEIVQLAEELRPLVVPVIIDYRELLSGY